MCAYVSICVYACVFVHVRVRVCVHLSLSERVGRSVARQVCMYVMSCRVVLCSDML